MLNRSILYKVFRSHASILLCLKEELFSRKKIEPSVSIIIKMKGSTKLTSQQVQAIQRLVTLAIPGLNTENLYY